MGHRPTSAIMQGTLFDCGEPPAQTKKKKQKDQGAYWVTTRLIRESGPHYLVPIKSPDQVAEIMNQHIDMENLDREMFCSIYLSRKNDVLAIHSVSIGGLASSLVHPREVFKPAFLTSAAAIILVHNHPSGDPTPSPEDLKVTKRLTEAGKLLGIEILDHVIIGLGRYVSLKGSNQM